MSTELIKVSRDGVQLGEYTLVQLPGLVNAGKLKLTDFYWKSGMDEWKPLSEIIEEATIFMNDQKAEADNVQRLRKLQAEKDRLLDDQRQAIKIAQGLWNCHCCRITFKQPKDPADDFFMSVVFALLSGILIFIPVIGWVIGPVVCLFYMLRILVSQLNAPHCPVCRSTNFSRPERIKE